MNVEVLLFAAAREAAGTDRMTVEVADGATVAALFDRLRELEPALAGVLASCRAAVDERFVTGAAELVPDSVVAVLPPVSGG